jgi:hypothetical protein
LLLSVVLRVIIPYNFSLISKALPWLERLYRTVRYNPHALTIALSFGELHGLYTGFHTRPL